MSSARKTETKRTLTELSDARVATSAERSSFPDNAVDAIVLEELRALTLDGIAEVRRAHNRLGDGDESGKGEENSEVHIGTAKTH